MTQQQTKRDRSMLHITSQLVVKLRCAARLVLLASVVMTSVILPFITIGEIPVNESWLVSYGRWAWLAGIIGLVADIFVAIPSSTIMTSLGVIYGPVIGGLIGSLGSFLSGMVAYGLSRLIPDRVTHLLLGKDRDAGKSIIVSWGPIAVACSRFLPILPETISCLAGMTRMPVTTFALAVLCGSIPVGFAYAMLPMFTSSDFAAIVISLLLPMPLWGLARFAISRHNTGQLPKSEETG